MIKKHLIGAANEVEKILSNRPLLARTVIRMLPLEWILGKKYRCYRRQFDRKDPVPDLLKMVQFAFSHVPYYRNRYSRIPARLDEFEQMTDFIDKKVLRKNGKELLSSLFDPDLYEMVTTSGSTGEPSVFYLPKDRFYKEWAYIHRIWSAKGYRGQLRAVLRNHKLKENETFRIHVFRRELIFDAYRNNEDYYRSIYDTLRRYRINYFQSYPHLAHSFFSFIRKKGWDVSFLKGVFLSSETFTDYQRRLLVDEMKLPVISIYGLSEKLALAADYNGNGSYEIIESYGYVELVDEQGNVIKETGKEGELVASTLDNYGMPLIRFRTGDLSSYKVYEKNKRILDGIRGRTGQVIYNPDGSIVSISSLNMHGDLLDYINGLQFYQPVEGEVEIRIIPAEGYNDRIKKRMIQYYRDRFSPEMTIKWNDSGRLETLKNGKLPVLISKIKK